MRFPCSFWQTSTRPFFHTATQLQKDNLLGGDWSEFELGLCLPCGSTQVNSNANPFDLLSTSHFLFSATAKGEAPMENSTNLLLLVVHARLQPTRCSAAKQLRIDALLAHDERSNDAEEYAHNHSRDITTLLVLSHEVVHRKKYEDLWKSGRRTRHIVRLSAFPTSPVQNRFFLALLQGGKTKLFDIANQRMGGTA